MSSKRDQVRTLQNIPNMVKHDFLACTKKINQAHGILQVQVGFRVVFESGLDILHKLRNDLNGW